ncbi:MAG: acyltransferase family protein [Candidatus Shapirobacteria bacterium]|nr:acyltransferase family protein [Candidatus Shapirobacteria bacterium]
MTPKDKIYNPTIDFIRLISILAVIMIHTSTKTLAASGNNLAGFPISLVLNQLSRFAVPLFFLISGFVLELNYSFQPNYFSYLKKRFNRILIPYLFWSLIYYFIVYTYHSENIFKVLVDGTASYQLYFIPSLIIFYLIFPLFHRLKYSKLILIFLGIIQIIILSLDYYFHLINLPYPISVALFNYFAFILGVVYSRNPPKLKYFVLTILAAAYVVYEGYNRFYQTGNYLSFYSQWRPSVLIYTVSLFLVFYNQKINHPLIQILSKLSFFVFFIHIIILEFTWSFVSRFYFFSGFDLLFFSLVTVISFSLAYLVHHIPKLSQLTG